PYAELADENRLLWPTLPVVERAVREFLDPLVHRHRLWVLGHLRHGRGTGFEDSKELRDTFRARPHRRRAGRESCLPRCSRRGWDQPAWATTSSTNRSSTRPTSTPPGTGSWTWPANP